MVRRDLMEKQFISRDGIFEIVKNSLEQMQIEMLEKARQFRETNSRNFDRYDELKDFLAAEGGFAHVHWCGNPACETKFKDDSNATIRTIPFDAVSEDGACIVCGKESGRRVIVARAY
jgi:prolyl-tRNA synthetase